MRILPYAKHWEKLENRNTQRSDCHVRMLTAAETGMRARQFVKLSMLAPLTSPASARLSGQRLSSQRNR